MSKNGYYGSRAKPAGAKPAGNAKAKAQILNRVRSQGPSPEGGAQATGPEDGEIRIIFVGESADIDFKGPREHIEEVRNHPAAADMTQEELGNEIAAYFDNGAHDMDLKARGQKHLQMPGIMTACFLGRHPFFDKYKEKANTFVLCGWRMKEGRGYFVKPLGAGTPKDKNLDPYDIIPDMVRGSLPVLDTIGFDDDSIFHKHRHAAVRRTDDEDLEGEEIVQHSDPRIQEKCDAAKTLFPRASN